MNRRSFLTDFCKGLVLSVAAPQIIVNGLKLKRVNSLYIPEYELMHHRFESVVFSFFPSIFDFMEEQLDQTKQNEHLKNI